MATTDDTKRVAHVAAAWSVKPSSRSMQRRRARRRPDALRRSAEASCDGHQRGVLGDWEILWAVGAGRGRDRRRRDGVEHPPATGQCSGRADQRSGCTGAQQEAAARERQPGRRRGCRVGGRDRIMPQRIQDLAVERAPRDRRARPPGCLATCEAATRRRRLRPAAEGFRPCTPCGASRASSRRLRPNRPS